MATGPNQPHWGSVILLSVGNVAIVPAGCLATKGGREGRSAGNFPGKSCITPVRSGRFRKSSLTMVAVGID